MTANLTDALWEHFAPLWTDLRGDSQSVLLAGGYGLFLKQKWLLLQELRADDAGNDTVADPALTIPNGTATLVDIRNWNDQTPRATNDFDFIVHLNLIASPAEQQRLDSTLLKHGFQVVERNARWQFERIIDANHRVILDFHVRPPVAKRDDVRVEARRVKPNPSLGQTGIHGRENTEAVGCELHPTAFSIDGVEILIPNPLTMTYMKLFALRDRRAASHDLAKSEGYRAFEDQQARKHAHDVCRSIAMLTRDENEHVGQVVEATRETTVFSEAADICQQNYLADDGWAARVVESTWRSDDYKLIRNQLETWFASFPITES